jgi:hypothetical protein
MDAPRSQLDLVLESKRCPAKDARGNEESPTTSMVVIADDLGLALYTSRVSQQIVCFGHFD